MYFDLIRQTLYYASPISCEIIPENVITLDIDSDEQYVLTPKLILPATPSLFDPKQIQSAKIPNTFNAQQAGIYSKADLKNFRDRVLFGNTLTVN